MTKLNKPKKKVHAPTIVALAMTVFIIISIFSLGFWAGVQSYEEPRQHRQAGPTFERSAAYHKMQQPLIERPF